MIFLTLGSRLIEKFRLTLALSLAFSSSLAFSLRKEFFVDSEDLGGDIGAFETADVFLTLEDAGLTTFGAFQHLKKGTGKGFRIIGGDIETGGASGFFETAAGTGNNGKTALDSFDNGNAKAFISGGIDAGLGHLIKGGKIGIGNSLQQMETGINSQTTGFRENLLGIRLLTTYNDEMEVFGQQGKGLDGQKDVLTLFDSAYMNDVAIGELVAGIDLLALVVADMLLKPRAARLIDKADLLFGDMAVMDDVALGTLGDGDDEVGLFQRSAELPGIDLPVYPFVVFGMAEEDEVMYGDNRLYATLADADGKFPAESMIELDAIAKEITDDAEGAPEK
jgi:hypothetical protein